ncbi:MAG TPA: hypothetical protein VHD32_08935 [Candidatus Didemnitutus sp.]|nr:hypothetical protein [Candidatus Didemnitutus sp.]
MNRIAFVALVLVAFLATSCGERGDKAISYGDELGQDWRPPAGAAQMRISVENYFTRDVVVQADAGSAHYELTVGPIRKRYMIVPTANYEINATTEERSTGTTLLHVRPDDRDGAHALLVSIRP